MSSLKIYTKIGDGGQTALGTGRMVQKDSPQVEAYGNVDELNSWLGLCSAQILLLPSQDLSAVAEKIERIQNELFQLGSELSLIGFKGKLGFETISEHHYKTLESEIDWMSESLAPLKNFILPGGGLLTSYLHCARSVCRRVERRLITFSHNNEELRRDIQIYINRLSDWLFVAARYANAKLGIPEKIWRGR